MPHYQQKRFQRIRLLLPLLCIAGLAPLQGQEKIPLTTGPLSKEDQSKRLEIEIISVGRFEAIPSSIRRRPGKFILAVLNESNDSEASFVIEPASADHGRQLGKPVLEFSREILRKGRAAGLFEAPVGRFQLKSAITGKVLCQITIE